MGSKLVVLADLGEMKAYRITRDPMQQSPNLELLNDMEFPISHGRFTEKYTDQAGRFPVYGQSGPMAIGEQHNLELEIERRNIRAVAEAISELIQQEHAEYWSFAAAPEINERILDELDPLVRAKLVRNLPVDLVKAGREELLRRF